MGQAWETPPVKNLVSLLLARRRVDYSRRTEMMADFAAEHAALVEAGSSIESFEQDSRQRRRTKEA